MFPVYYNLYNKAINGHIYTGLPHKGCEFREDFTEIIRSSTLHSSFPSAVNLIFPMANYLENICMV